MIPFTLQNMFMCLKNSFFLFSNFLKNCIILFLVFWDLPFHSTLCYWDESMKCIALHHYFLTMCVIARVAELPTRRFGSRGPASETDRGQSNRRWGFLWPHLEAFTDEKWRPKEGLDLRPYFTKEPHVEKWQDKEEGCGFLEVVNCEKVHYLGNTDGR